MQAFYKCSFLFILLCLFGYRGLAQTYYWQQQVNYNIQVTLNDAAKTLDAFEQITYINNSPDTLRSIPFHLWTNAYKNDKTAFSEQLLRNNNTSFYFSNVDTRGYINGLQFRVNNDAATFIVDSDHIDIITLLLPKPLPPGDTAHIETPFHSKLPYNFSRSGYEGETFQIAQWYPKPAVYDKKGWHPMPYLDQGEFYSEFGNYNVSITLPKNYVVAASGKLGNEEELKFLKQMGSSKSENQPNYTLWNSTYKQRAVQLQQRFFNVMPPSSSSLKTLHYTLDSAHDFAFFASKLFLVQYDTIHLQNKAVDAFTFYNPWNEKIWKNSLYYVKNAIHFYSQKLGEYPYNEISAVLGDAEKQSGGMEYPTITLLEMNDSAKNLDATLTHEIGHNWLYGVLATNERDHAWMDEGINTYYERKYLQQFYEPITYQSFPYRKFPAEEDTLALQILYGLHKDQQIETTSDSLTYNNYNVTVYSKAAMWLATIEKQLGTTVFDSCMKHYYNIWKFKHPYPTDFQNSLQACSDQNLSQRFAQLYTTGSPLPQQKKTVKPTFLFNEKQTDKYHYLSFAPALGFNYYDKVMIGGLIHNYQLPLNRFNFLVAPLYATGSKALQGASRFSFSTFTKRSWLEVAASAVRFNSNAFTQYNNSKLFFGMSRVVPSVKLRLYNKDLRSSQRWTFTAKSYLISEQKFQNFTPVTIPPDTFYFADKQTIHRYVNELKATVTDNRKLYPYTADVTLQQGSTFMRAGFTGEYYFNYTTPHKGIQTRFFGGKFFYLNGKNVLSKSENNRYFLSLSGPDGYHDYTYSDYFLARNEYDNGLSQQIMQRDGFFKVSTPLLSEAIGASDNWLLSVNVSGDIPDEMNPLQLLPVQLPIQFFLDIGTYSDAWKSESATGSFLYDAGLKVSILNNAFSVYIPILYSKVYRDYYKSFYPQKRLAHTISFGFNLNQLQPNKLIRSLPL